MLLEEDEQEVGRDTGPQHVAVVTTEYLASGLDDPEYSAFEAANDTHIGDEDAHGFVLTEALVRPIGRLLAPPRTFPNWQIPSMQSVIALLAEDTPAQETLLDFWADFNIPFKVVIYTGEFIVEGTMFSDDEDPPEFYRQAFRPIEVATITHQGENKVDLIRVRLGLINVAHIHGFTFEKSARS